ncbi:MAG: hypothetical protein ACI9S6_000419 [Reinekea sp.]|jgi:hypothetical protein
MDALAATEKRTPASSTTQTTVIVTPQPSPLVTSRQIERKDVLSFSLLSTKVEQSS